MTEKLYYEDVYMKTFEATVTELAEVGGKIKAALDRTAFYPEGGGQPADAGIIVLAPGREALVSDVHEKDGVVWHTIEAIREKGTVDAYCGGTSEQTIEGAAPAHIKTTVITAPADIAARIIPGAHVTGRIDWGRRFDHMQQHSGEHIVSGMICSEFGCNNVGFHMGSDCVTIDYDAKISFEEAVNIEDRANRYIWENHKINISWPSADELKKINYRSKKELTGAVRITEWPGADICACCGTHVLSSAEVGLVKFASAHPFHDGTRLELYCGKRAYEFLSASHKSNSAVAGMLSTQNTNTAKVVEKQLKDFADLKASMAELEDRFFEMWAQRFSGQDKALIIDERLSPDQGRRLADAVSDVCGGMTVVIVPAGGTIAAAVNDKNTEDISGIDKTNGTGGSDAKRAYRYSVINKHGDITAFVKEMNAALNGKGGGRGGFAQGTLSASENEVREFLDGIK